SCRGCVVFRRRGVAAGIRRRRDPDRARVGRQPAGAAAAGRPQNDDLRRALSVRVLFLTTVLAVALCACAGTLASTSLTASARADGDPGSDVLVNQNLFFGYDAGVTVPQQVEMGTLLDAASKAGFPVRVA